MNYQTDKEHVINTLIAKAKSLQTGTEITTCELFSLAFPDNPLPNIQDLFDLHETLVRQSEAAGLFFDFSRNWNQPQDYPASLVFIITPLKPVVSFDTIQYYESTWGTYIEELTLDLKNKGISYRYSKFKEYNAPRFRKYNPRGWAKIANLASVCRFDQWEKDYINPGVLDGTSWNMKLLKEGKIVKECFGSNSYPVCEEIFTELKKSCNRLFMIEMRAAKKLGKQIKQLDDQSSDDLIF